ncbi:MAG: VUT family protein [Rhodospirillales bacterium]|nr:VUT family protein [Rhodospirillales bacterium]
MMDDALRRRIGSAAFVAFLGLIPLANWMVLHLGTVCVARGPCLIPVAPGLMAPSGVITVGAALVLRDVVQRCLGLAWGLVAIAAGTALSALVAPAALVVASGVAFLLSETADFAVYTPLARRRLVLAVAASAGLGLAIDSMAFLWLAFGSLQFLAGQIVGKLWAVAISIPFIRLLRRVAPA